MDYRVNFKLFNGQNYTTHEVTNLPMILLNFLNFWIDIFMEDLNILQQTLFVLSIVNGILKEELKSNNLISLGRLT